MATRKATLATTFRWSALKRPNAFVIPGVLAIFVVAAALMYQWTYGQRVYIGVRSVNMGMGGMRYDQVANAIESWYGGYEGGKLSLRYGQREWVVAPSEVGLALDLDASTQAVFAVGRGGNPIQNWTGRLSAVMRGRNVEPVLSLDEGAARAYLSDVARDIDRPVHDAHYVVDVAGMVQISPARPGEKLDVEASLERLQTAPRGTRVIELAVDTTRPSALERDLQAGASVEKLASSQPFTLQYEKAKRTFQPADLAAMLAPAGGGSRGGSAYRMDLGPIRAAVDDIAKQVNRPPAEAKLEKKGSQVSVTDSAAGVAVDVEATLARVREQVITEDRTVNLEAAITQPVLSSDEVVAIRDTANRITAEPLVVKYESQAITVTKDTLAAAVVLKQSEADGKKMAQLSFDDARMKAMVDRMAEAFNRPARDAKVRFSSGKVIVTEQAKDGLKVKSAETLSKLSSALLAGEHSFTPEMDIAKATGPSSNLEQIIVDELLMDSSTSYAGASAPKRHNVELATSRLDGILIAPGEVFSFNRALGPTRIADGYKMGWGIAVSGGEAVTIPSEAGGICQVVTTLFHSVFWSGMKIQERWPHMYWINSYGQPPRGMRGLDATVDGNTIDFRFENNTGSWVAVHAWTANSKIYFELWGKDPGWKVEVDGPKIEKIVPTDREIIYRDDASMDPGQELQVESAMDGFLATVHRTVSKGGKVISELTVRSEYVPAHNVVLVHPRPATPTVTTTTTAGPSVAPTRAPAFTPTPRPGQPTPVATTPPISTARPSPTATPKR